MRLGLIILAAVGLWFGAQSLLGGDEDWRSADRCRPIEDPAPGDHPGDGPGLSAAETLADPQKCPEMYAEGSGGGRWAPEIEIPQPDSGERGEDGDVHPCQQSASLNGFYCKRIDGVEYPVYPSSPSEDR